MSEVAAAPQYRPISIRRRSVFVVVIQTGTMTTAATDGKSMSTGPTLARPTPVRSGPLCAQVSCATQSRGFDDFERFANVRFHHGLGFTCTRARASHRPVRCVRADFSS